jgi:heme-degrading monooxygenase HmoA
MLYRIVRMSFKKEELQNFLELFHSSKNRIRNFPGCRHLELMKDAENECLLSTFSIWDSSADLENYRKSELFAGVWKETKVKFASKPVAFSLSKFVEVDGLEKIL